MTSKEKVNGFLDRWRWVMAIVGILSIMGASVAWPGSRITKLEDQREQDRAQLEATTTYLRVLATAQCLDQNRPHNDLMRLMCDRVLHDPSVLALPK